MPEYWITWSVLVLKVTMYILAKDNQIWCFILFYGVIGNKIMLPCQDKCKQTSSYKQDVCLCLYYLYYFLAKVARKTAWRCLQASDLKITQESASTGSCGHKFEFCSSRGEYFVLKEMHNLKNRSEMSSKVDWTGRLFPLHVLFRYSRITRVGFYCYI